MASSTTSPGGKFHFWRKNRQPTPGTTAKGTDLNRNFGYKWGGGGRTSSNPIAITYRGPKAFSAPETRAMRDFLASRVVGGRQQIRTAITFHEDGRLVMWPYGYTFTDIPGDMTKDDHAALMKIGKHMAATNGYKPEQASDLYISSGTTRDYLYGTYRVFSYTFEMSIGAYMDDSKIASETGRNKEAVLYLIERASCPLGVLGATVRQARCGAFDDDFEVGRGWQVNPDGTDTAPAAARFARGNPGPTALSGPKQLGTTPSGSRALVTGPLSGSKREHRRPRWTDDRPVIADHPRADGGTAAHVPICLRPRREVHVRGPVPGHRGAGRRIAGPRGHEARDAEGPRWSLADRIGLDGRVRRPDRSPSVLGRGWRASEPCRGRDRRRAGDQGELSHVTAPSRTVTRLRA